MRPVRHLVRPALIVLLVIAALPATLGPSAARPAEAVRPTPSTTAAPSPSPVTPPVPVLDDRPPPLTLDMAVGQMMAASFGGPSITDGLSHLILDEKVGTVLIFSDNFTDAASLFRLTRQLQRRPKPSIDGGIRPRRDGPRFFSALVRS